MTATIRHKLPMSALVLLAGLCMAAGAARADDAIKPAADAMKTDSAAMADCKDKAAMETDQMKKDEAMKACDDMMKSDGGMMKSGDKGAGTMKPAQSN
jgi:hypothetical protein